MTGPFGRPPEDRPRPSEQEIEDMREETVEDVEEIVEERGEYVRIKLMEMDDVYKHYSHFHPSTIANIDDIDTHELVEGTDEVKAKALSEEI